MGLEFFFFYFFTKNGKNPLALSSSINFCNVSPFTPKSKSTGNFLQTTLANKQALSPHECAFL